MKKSQPEIKLIKFQDFFYYAVFSSEQWQAIKVKIPLYALMCLKRYSALKRKSKQCSPKPQPHYFFPHKTSSNTPHRRKYVPMVFSARDQPPIKLLSL